MTSPAIRFQRLHADTKQPERATKRSAGYDLFAYLRGRRIVAYNEHNEQYAYVVADEENAEIKVPYRHRVMVPLGFKARLPEAYEAQIRPRSGNALKQGQVIVNSPGTIDADYPEEWMVLVGNDSLAPLTIVHGNKVAQMVLAKYAVLPFEEDEVDVTTDRTGGFGSTGK